MKTSIRIFVLMLCATASIAYADKYYFFGDADKNNTFQNKVVWSTDAVEQVIPETAPDGTSDIYVNDKASVNSISANAKFTEIGSLTVTDSYSKTLLTLLAMSNGVEHFTFRIKNDIMLESYSATGERVTAIAPYDDGNNKQMNLFVGGNITVNSGNTLKLGSTEPKIGNSVSSNNYVEIGDEEIVGSGDIKVNASAGLAASVRFCAVGAVGGSAASIENPNVLVRGVVKLYSPSAPNSLNGQLTQTVASMLLYSGDLSKQELDASKRATFVSVGGVDGKGVIYGDTLGTRTGDEFYKLETNLIFSNSDDYTFSGGILKVYNEKIDQRSADDVNLNLIMNGSGKQTIKGTTVKVVENSTIKEKGVQVSTVTVNKGTLEISNASTAGSYGDITLNGGCLGIASFYGAADDTVGAFYADSITWNAGKIAIDIIDGKADTFNLTNFFKGDASDFVFDFTILGDIYENKNYTIATITGSFEFDDKEFKTIVSGSELYARIFWDATAKELNVNFSKIPEPATAAIILGALALAFAFILRRF